MRCAMARDWIKFEGGKDWNDGDDYIWVRISTIQGISTHPVNEKESLIHTADVQFEVLGTPEEIMEMINARTSS